MRKTAVMRRPSLPRPSFSRPSLPRPRFSRPSLRRSKPAASGAPNPSPRSEWQRRIGAGVAILIVAAIGFGVGYLVFDEPDSETSSAPAPTAVVVEGGPQPEAVEEIGFPAFATRNTTRVSGVDPTAAAAGVALASYPSQGGVGGPQAAILAPADSWQAALAATPLTADPLASPLLLGGPDEVPPITEQALAGLAPIGLDEADGAEVIAIGDVVAPADSETLAIDGADPAAIADEVDVQRAELTGVKDPDHLLVVSSEAPAYAMPAGAWAARSGDPILFADGNEVPEGTLAVVERHPDAPIYVLGPESVISAKALSKLEQKGAKVTRVGSEDPIENAITFARFVDGDFGWNINDPGHGFTIANTNRPLDAAAGAPLAAGGKPGPMLLTDDSETLPTGLSGFLVDTQPGFIDDPTRAVYNHIWLLGDEDAISVAFQAQVDELTKLAPVSDGTRVPAFPNVGAPPNGSTPPDDLDGPGKRGKGADADGRGNGGGGGGG